MPLVSVELPSGEVKKLGLDPKTTLRQIALMVEVKPENAVFFVDRHAGKLGTLIGNATDDAFEVYNSKSIVIIDKTNISEKNTERFKEALNRGYGGRSTRRTRRRSSKRSTRRQ
jgi:hypothetical protein